MGICQGLASNSSSELYAAWKGKTGDDRLFFATFNGTRWSNANTMLGNSSVGPALAFNGGILYAAWKGIYGDNRLFSAKWNGSSWADAITIDGNSDIGPTLASLNGKLYAAWKGEADLRLFFAEFDGRQWLTQAQMVHNGSSAGFTSCMGPSLTNFNGNILAVWRGAIYDQSIHYATFNGSGWTAPVVLPNAATSTCPSVVAYGGNAYVVWKGEGTDERMYLGWFDSGLNWHGGNPITEIPCTSSLGAALCTFGGNMFAMWKGADTDQQLFCGSFNGSAWTAEPNAPGNTGGDMAPMPSGGLGSDSNYIFSTNNCEPVTALSVEVTLTAPLDSSAGFGIQLNCNAGLNQISAWQQYILVYYPQPGTFACQIDNWTTTAELLNSALPYFCPFAGHTVPTGTIFAITLAIDPHSHKVTGASYSVQVPGQSAVTKTLAIHQLKLGSGVTATTADMSPIAAFQVNIVALDQSTTKIITGAGNIVYTVSPAMYALTDFPTCVEYIEVSGEGTNSFYGQVPLGASNSYTQWLAAAAT